jgi:hypothetical protein
MPARVFFLLLCASLLVSCSDYFESDAQPAMRQHAQTNPMGQTTYTYRPADEPASR